LTRTLLAVANDLQEELFECALWVFNTNNVSAVLFHKRLPIIISAGEDGTIRLW